MSILFSDLVRFEDIFPNSLIFIMEPKQSRNNNKIINNLSDHCRITHR